MASDWYDGLTPTQRAFFVLLRSGLWESPVEDLSLFPLSASAWQQVFLLSEQQTVQGLLYHGFQQLPTHLYPPQPLVWRWVASVSQLEKAYNHVAKATEATGHILRDIGLQPILQKGLAVAQYYEHPELRVNGDIDWYIGKETDTDTICQALLAKGYDCEVRADQSICFDYDGIDIELHRQLIDLDAPAHARASQCIIDDQNITVLLMLCAHILKHVCTVGIGLRQFCDMARAYQKLHECYDERQLVETYRQTGMMKWSGLLHQVLMHFLGLPAVNLPAPVPTMTAESRKLVRCILRWGNFGQNTAPASKWHTVSQIVRQLPFALRYAPVEAAYRIWHLIIGQKYITHQHE